VLVEEYTQVRQAEEYTRVQAAGYTQVRQAEGYTLVHSLTQQAAGHNLELLAVVRCILAQAVAHNSGQLAAARCMLVQAEGQLLPQASWLHHRLYKKLRNLEQKTHICHKTSFLLFYSTVLVQSIS